MVDAVPLVQLHRTEIGRQKNIGRDPSYVERSKRFGMLE